MTPNDLLTLSEPLDAADVPVVEIAATTRREEARSAMAVVSALMDAGVGVRDVAVVARDLDIWEESLYRAAVHYGLTPVFWTQLRVTQTTPFALLEAVCDALGADELEAGTLCRPLEYRWSPPSASSEAWPLAPRTIQSQMEALPDGARTLDEWHDELLETDGIDDRLVTYVEWLNSRPEPTPDAVSAVLGDVVEAYERLGLPVTKERDSQALVETERDARAVVRVQTLVRQLPHKYEDRLDEGTLTESWGDVAELAHLITTQRPGRREHSNARAVDVFESNDIWLLDMQYVIAVGLIDGEWPQTTESVLPPELQEAILAGEDGTGALAPRTAWTDGRDRDQFDDTVRAASSGLILTRHTETIDGEERRPSNLLDYLDSTVVGEDERRQLLSPERTLPEPLREIVATQEGMLDD
ncbi:hypothetical protein DVK02_13725 [Halobellus sp. Atlit-31R]|nr:hypothetical protein DVK02_13725 [Halobellus sp. Atlit-31R]